MPGPEDKDPKKSKWERTKEILWDSNLNAPVRGFYNLMNTSEYDLLTNKGEGGRKAVEASTDAAAGMTAGSSVVPKPRGSIGMGGGRAAKDITKGSARESWARGPARAAADLKKGDTRSTFARGPEKKLSAGQQKLMDALNKSRGANEAARTKAARVARNSPTASEQAALGRAKRNAASPPTASEMGRIGRAKRNDSSLNVFDRAKLARMERNSPSAAFDSAKAKAARMERNSPGEAAKRGQGRKVAAAVGATAAITGGYYGATRWKAGKSEAGGKVGSVVRTPPSRPVSSNKMAKKEGAITQTDFAKRRQGRNNPESTANQGNKKNKPTQLVKQGGFKGNWKGAAPYKAPSSLKEATRRGASDAFMRRKVNKRNLKDY